MCFLFDPKIEVRIHLKFSQSSQNYQKELISFDPLDIIDPTWTGLTFE
jgi:hypothetical protein